MTRFLLVSSFVARHPSDRAVGYPFSSAKERGRRTRAMLSEIRMVRPATSPVGAQHCESARADCRDEVRLLASATRVLGSRQGRSLRCGCAAIKACHIFASDEGQHSRRGGRIERLLVGRIPDSKKAGRFSEQAEVRAFRCLNLSVRSQTI